MEEEWGSKSIWGVRCWITTSSERDGAAAGIGGGRSSASTSPLLPAQMHPNSLFAYPNSIPIPIGIRNNPGFLTAAALASVEMLFSQAATRCQHFREFVSREAAQLREEPRGGLSPSAPPAPLGVSRNPSVPSGTRDKDGQGGGKRLHGRWRAEPSLEVEEKHFCGR